MRNIFISLVLFALAAQIILIVFHTDGLVPKSGTISIPQLRTDQHKVVPTAAPTDKIIAASTDQPITTDSATLPSDRNAFLESRTETPTVVDISNTVAPIRSTAVPQKQQSFQTQPTRVAILVSYVGDSLPSWFDTFVLTASTSASTFDWLIFITDTQPRPCPENVKLITLAKEDLYSRIAKLDISEPENSEEKMFDTLAATTRLLETEPYVLVEFKPCLGIIFADYLVNYSHWAYADVDQLLGDMSSLIPVNVLNQYEIYTASFGDSYRMYMRGQLTIHKNLDHVNAIWRDCPQLNFLRKRLMGYVKRHYHWHFVSAEGCYSRAVANHVNVSLYIGNTQLTDAYHSSSRDRESLVLGNNLVRCYDEPINLPILAKQQQRQQQASQVLRFGNADGLNDKPQVLLNILNETFMNSLSIKELSLLNYRCAYWVSPEYQVCLDRLPASADIIRTDGQLYFYDGDAMVIPGSACRHAAIGHFQGWKGSYYYFTSRPPPLDSHALLLSDVGYIPYRINYEENNKNEKNNNVMNFGESYKLSQHYGKVSIKDAEIKKHTNPSVTATTDATAAAAAAASATVASSYCIGFSSSLKRCICSVPLNSIHLVFKKSLSVKASLTADSEAASISNGSNSNNGHNVSITQISIGWKNEMLSSSSNNNLRNVLADDWDGDRLIVLAKHPALSNNQGTDVNAGTDDSEEYSRILSSFYSLSPMRTTAATTAAEVSEEDDGILVSIVEVDVNHCKHHLLAMNLKNINSTNSSTNNTDDSCNNEYYILPDKTLYNIALDLVETDRVLIMPSLTPTTPTTTAMAMATNTATTADNAVEAGKNDSVSSLNLTMNRVNGRKYSFMFTGNSRPTTSATATAAATKAAITTSIMKPLLAEMSTLQQQQQLEHGTDTPVGIIIPFQHIHNSNNNSNNENDDDSIYSNIQINSNTDHGWLNFRVQEYVVESSVLFPIVFQQSSSPHGTGFIRFPEELNGCGCFDSYFVRILYGSGLKLAWSDEVTMDILHNNNNNNNSGNNNNNNNTTNTRNHKRDKIDNICLVKMAAYRHHIDKIQKSTIATASSSPSTTTVASTVPSLSLANVTNEVNESLVKMLIRFNRFYSRAVQLRQGGIEDVYTRSKFGVNFEKEQHDLMKA